MPGPSKAHPSANHSRSLSLGQRQRQRRHELTSSADGGPGPWVGRPLPVPRSLTASPPRSHGRLSVPCPRPPATCPRPRPYHANSDGEPRMEYGGRATAHSRSTTPSAIACWVALGLKVNARPARPRPSVAAQGIGARVRSAVNPSPCTATAREHLLPSFPPPPGAVWCSSCVDRHRHVLVEIDSGATATPHPHAWVQQVDVDPRAYGRTDGRTGRGLGVVGHSLAGPLLARRSWRCACPPHLIAVDAQARRGSDTLAGRAMVVERRRERPHAVDARPPCQAARRPHAIPSKSGDALPGSCSSSTLSRRPVTSYRVSREHKIGMDPDIYLDVIFLVFFL